MLVAINSFDQGLNGNRASAVTEALERMNTRPVTLNCHSDLLLSCTNNGCRGLSKWYSGVSIEV